MTLQPTRHATSTFRFLRLQKPSSSACCLPRTHSSQLRPTSPPPKKREKSGFPQTRRHPCLQLRRRRGPLRLGHWCKWCRLAWAMRRTQARSLRKENVNAPPTHNCEVRRTGMAVGTNLFLFTVEVYPGLVAQHTLPTPTTRTYILGSRHQFVRCWEFT